MKKITLALALALAACTTVGADPGVDGGSNVVADGGTNADSTVATAGTGIAWSGGVEKLVITDKICPGTNGQAMVVGQCMAAQTTGWTSGNQTVTKDANGNYTVLLSGAVEEDCQIDLYDCNVTTDICPAGAEWSNQGCNRLYEPGTHNGGPFMGLLTDGSPIMFHYAPGQEPAPMGVLPDGP